MSRFDYMGARRSMISFPLGGIGTGSLGLSGTGRLVDWELFNRPNKNSANGFSHFAVKAEDENGLVCARVLNADQPAPYMGGNQSSFGGFGYGVDRATMSGLPHYADCTFTGKFPFASIRFEDGVFPGKVEMRAFNPFIPTNEDDSSIPAAFFTFEVTNTSDRRLAFTLAGSVRNPFAGAHENTSAEDGAVRMLRFRDCAHKADDPAFGDLTLATDAPLGDVQTYWYRGSWFDNIAIFWKDFTSAGKLRARHYDDPNGADDHGTLTARLSLAAGESREVRFVLAWNVPNNHNYWTPNDAEGKPKKSWRNWYATRFADSAASAAYALANWNRLDEETRLFADALFASTLPEEALDAVSATMSVLKSPTVLRLEDGSLYGWEGCGPNGGSCEGSCSHVWAYTYAMPFLFPKLERSMRDNEYLYTQDEHGGLRFRLQLPLGSPYWDFRPCADGQFATVFKTYREHKISGDRDWLASRWDGVRKALAYAWDDGNPDRWDPERSGVLTGRQHHTLDMELFGPNAWLNGMYLCALRAGEEMARVMGDGEAAALYHDVFERGSAWSNEHLFNGEYFRQNVDLHDKSMLERYDAGATIFGQNALSAYWNDEAGELKYQIGDGCAIDQVLGQWHADMIGLGDVFDRDKVDAALAAIYRHNFISMREHVNPCRLYCLNDERGALICSYPEGHERPVLSVPYAEETMHGFEYQAAAHMVARGMVDKGMDIVRAVRDRYDGERRNPWNEIECGSNYARSMASYALLLAFSGMTYDLGRGQLGFAPVVAGDFRCFWSLGSGFGTVAFEGGEVSLDVLYGKLTIRELDVPGSYTSCTLDGDPAAFRYENGAALFDTPVTILAGETLILR